MKKVFVWLFLLLTFVSLGIVGFFGIGTFSILLGGIRGGNLGDYAIVKGIQMLRHAWYLTPGAVLVLYIAYKVFTDED